VKPDWEVEIADRGWAPGARYQRKRGFGKDRFMSVDDVLECGTVHLGAQRHVIR
jgi:hypothetical protein